MRGDALPQALPIRRWPRTLRPAAPRAGHGLAPAIDMQWGAHSSTRSTSAVRVENTVRSSLVEIPSTPAYASIPRDSYGARFGFPAQSHQNDNSPWLPSRQFPTGVAWLSPSSSRKRIASCPRAFAPLAPLEPSPDTSPVLLNLLRRCQQ